MKVTSPITGFLFALIFVGSAQAETISCYFSDSPGQQQVWLQVLDDGDGGVAAFEVHYWIDRVLTGKVIYNEVKVALGDEGLLGTYAGRMTGTSNAGVLTLRARSESPLARYIGEFSQFTNQGIEIHPVQCYTP